MIDTKLSRQLFLSVRDVCGVINFVIINFVTYKLCDI
jgi:hypothetical protein